MRGRVLVLTMFLGVCVFAASKTMPRLPLPRPLPPARLTAVRERLVGTENDYTYRTVPGGVSIIGYSGKEPTLTIPPMLAGKPVVEIADGYFHVISHRKIAALPDSLRKIGRGAFYDCEFSTLELPEGLREIGEEAFAFCEIEELSLPEGLEAIGRGAFRGCDGLKGIFVPGGVSLGGDAFEYCAQLEWAALGEGIRETGEGTFKDCFRLARVRLPDSLEKIGPGAFANCGSLASLELPEGLAEIDDCAFWNCGSLTEAAFPKRLRRIGNGAFWNCVKLETDASAAKETGGGAFWNCAAAEKAPENALAMAFESDARPVTFGFPGKWRTYPEPEQAPVYPDVIFSDRTYYTPRVNEDPSYPEAGYPNQQWVEAAKQAVLSADLYGSDQWSQSPGWKTRFSLLTENGQAGAKPTIDYAGGLYEDFDGDGRMEGVLLLMLGYHPDLIWEPEVEKSDRINGGINFALYINADGTIQPLNMQGMAISGKLMLISYAGHQQFTVFYNVGTMTGVSATYSVSNGWARSQNAPTPHTYDVYGPILVSHIVRTPQYELQFWNREEDMYSTVGPVEMPADLFLELYRPAALRLDDAHFFVWKDQELTNEQFFQKWVGDPEILAEEIDGVQVLANKFYQIRFTEAAAGSRGSSGVTLIRMVDGLWGVYSCGRFGPQLVSSAPMVYDVDFDSAYREALWPS